MSLSRLVVSLTALVLLGACAPGEDSGDASRDSDSGGGAGADSSGPVVPLPDVAEGTRDVGVDTPADGSTPGDAALATDSDAPVDRDAGPSDATSDGTPDEAASPTDTATDDGPPGDVPPRDDAAPRDDPPPGPGCDPPRTIEIDGRCIPTCGAAGGNACVAAGSTRCDFLPHLESYDCEICCAFPPSPPLRANSHNTVVIADIWHWDAIRTLADRGLGPMITSQNRPDDLPWERWTRNVHWESTGGDGVALADAVHAVFANPDGAPNKVLIDELKTASQDTIVAFAERMAERYPQWRGRWGAYIVAGEAVHYANLTRGIDALLLAGAILVPELYFHQSRYCASGSSADERDVWLGHMFRGDAHLARVHWLVQRGVHYGSDSQISPMFGVTDHYLDGRSPAVYLDRMFYVFVTRSDYRGLALEPNGGIGAWKWDGDAMANTSRDLAFAESFEHYSVLGRTDSRLGQVPCD